VNTSPAAIATVTALPSRVAKPKARPKSAGQKSRKPRKFGVIGQIRQAFSTGNRLAATVGLLLGGFVPAAVSTIAHGPASASFEGHEIAWALVAGGLVYSAKTVFEWASLAFTNKPKALGFVLLLEGVMVTGSAPHWLQVAALAYLVAINATATACTLAGGK